MKVLTYTSYKEHSKLYAKIQNLILVSSCQIGLARKGIILLSNVAVILYRAGSRTGVKDRRIKFTLSAGTYFIDNFNAKVKVVVLQERQDWWKPPQIKGLKLVIQKTTRVKSTLPSGSYKTYLDTLPHPIIIITIL